MLPAQYFVSELEQSIKMDVEITIQHAKQHLVDTITQTGAQIAKSFEDEIRNKVVEKIGLKDKTDERYGEMTDLQKHIDRVDEIISRIGYNEKASEIIDVCFVINAINSSSCDYTFKNKYNNIDWLFCLPNEDNKNIGNNKSHLGNPNSSNESWSQRCTYYPQNKCNVRHFRILNERDIVQYNRQLFAKKIMEWTKNNINKEYVVNCVAQIELVIRSGKVNRNYDYKRNTFSIGEIGYYFSIKAINVTIITNMMNIFVIKCENDKGNLQLVCEKKIETNIKMNNIFIDICKQWKQLVFVCDKQMLKDKWMSFVYSDLELKQIEDNISNSIEMINDQCKVISEKIKIYWGSSGLGSFALNFEKTFNDLQQAKQQIETLENETDIKTKEIAKLKKENEKLQEQLADIDMFKQCVAMMQYKQMQISEQLQIGNPV